MRFLNALVTGLQRVLGSPMIILTLYAAGLMVAVPLAVIMRGVLQGSMGASLVDERMTEGFDMHWYGEFNAGASGLAETFGPQVTGFLPVLGNLERLLDGTVFGVNGIIVLAGMIYLLVWAYLSGGIIDRYAQPMGATSPERFHGQCGENFLRFVRLQLLSLFFYWLLFRWVANPLHGWVTSLNRDTTDETTVMVHTFTVYAFVALLLMVLGMVNDYAKISIVTERRSSALLAMVRGAGFTLSKFVHVFPLYLALLLMAAIVFLLYGWIAPGPGQSTVVGIFLAFVAGQVYLLARLTVKLWFLSSQAILFVSDDPRGMSY